VSRRSLISALLPLALALLAPASANAAPYKISFQPSAPVAGQAVTFHAERPGQGGNDILAWNFGDGVAGAGPAPSHTYAATGTYTVTLTVSSGSNPPEEPVSTKVTVAPNAAPSVAFTFAPANPVEGAGVSFFSDVSDPERHTVTLAWAFGDGATSTASAPVHSYAAAGDYLVKLTATDQYGASGFSSRNITVTDTPAPTGGTSGPTGQPQAPTQGGTTPGGVSTPVSPLLGSTPLVRMSPFPIVRIAGEVLVHGARLRILSVRAPRGSRVRVRCSGRGCPVGSVARTSATRLLRFHQFERRLRAGVKLELFVRQAGRIGKYTRFRILAGDPPARLDRCLVPGRSRPTRCP
jgi:PKD repeat protein